MDADYSFYVKSIATFALTFFGYIISVLATVNSQRRISHSFVEMLDAKYLKIVKKVPNGFLQKRNWQFANKQ